MKVENGKIFGDKLFDVLSEAAIKTLEEGRCFDSDFYEDQNDSSFRKLVIETVRVREEFVARVYIVHTPFILFLTGVLFNSFNYLKLTRFLACASLKMN